MSRAASRALRTIAALSVGSAVVAPRQPESPPTTVLLVRHAERAAVAGRDPPLDAVGLRRAAALRDALADAGVTVIYTTPLQRTRQTAAPLAERLRLAPAAVPLGAGAAEHAERLAAEILDEQKGEVVLVVGHSNTLPPLIRELGGSAPSDIADHEFDNLFIVTVPEGGSGRVRTVRARYGAPNPPPR